MQHLERYNILISSGLALVYVLDWCWQLCIRGRSWSLRGIAQCGMWLACSSKTCGPYWQDYHGEWKEEYRFILGALQGWKCPVWDNHLVPSAHSIIPCLRLVILTFEGEETSRTLLASLLKISILCSGIVVLRFSLFLPFLVLATAFFAPWNHQFQNIKSVRPKENLKLKVLR